MPDSSTASTSPVCPVSPGVFLPESLVASLYGVADGRAGTPRIDRLDLKQLHAPAGENKPAYDTDGPPPTSIVVQMGQPVADALTELIDVYRCDWCEGAFLDVLADAALPCYQGFEVRFASGALHTAQGANYCAECVATGEILRCRVCGCTQAAACAEGCEWAEVDMQQGGNSLCTSCVSGKHVGEDEADENHEEGDDAPDI